METSKFMGVGLKNALLLFMFITVMIVITKVVFTKYHVEGISQVVQAI